MALILSNATGGGLASATTSWAGGVIPVLGDSVQIVGGDTIEIDGTYSWGDDTSTGLVVNGVIKASRTVNSDLTVRGDFNVVNAGSDFDYGTLTSPIPASVKAVVQLNDSAVLANGKYGLIVATNAGYHVYGAFKKTNTHLTAIVLAGATTFTVTDATGWEIGDTVVLATTFQGDANSQDERVITGITGNTITVSALTYQHESNCPVGNFTKNVKIIAKNSAYESYQDLKHNTTVVSREIQQLEVQYMGSNVTSTKFGGVRIDGQGSEVNPYASIGNIVGYATHYAVIDIYNTTGRITIDDCASYNPASGWYGYLLRQSAVVTFNRCYTYKSSNGLSSTWSQGGVNCIFNDCWITGGTTNGITLSSAQGFVFNNCIFANCVGGVAFGWGASHVFNNCDIGYQYSVGNGLNKNGIVFLGNALTKGTFISCNYNNTYDVTSYITSANNAMKVVIANKNGSPANQEIYLPTGTLKRDNTQFKTGTASLQANPTNANISLQNEWDVFAPSGQLVVVSGYLRKNTSYGSATLPKVTLTGLGIVDSVFTMTDVNDTYVQFTVSGSQTTGTDGILTLRAEFQSGNAGAQAWIDGIVAPVSIPVNSGDIGYWAVGQPAKLLASNFTSPDDIWNKLTSGITLAGSIGKQLKDNIDIKTSESGVTEI